MARGSPPRNARSGERPPVRDDGKGPTRGLVCDTALDSSGCRVEGTDSVDLIKVTEDATQPEPESRGLHVEPMRREPNRWGRRLLGSGVAIVTGVVMLIWAMQLYPQTLPEPLPEVALITSALSLFLVVPGMVALGLAVFAWRIGWRWVAGATAAVSLLSLLGVLLPWATQASTAAEHNVPLSLSGYVANPDPGKPTQTVTYAILATQQLQLDVWQADRPGPGRLGVVWAHGGGWVSGDRANWSLPKWGRWMSDSGTTMFSVDYRLPTTGSGMGALTPDMKAQEAADVKCALGWVQAHAAEYGVDPTNLMLAGDSAGAHLAMLTAYTIGTPNLPPSCPVNVVPVKAVVSLYGITYSNNPAEGEVMPINYVRQLLPPTLLIQGLNDHTVAPDNAPRMASQLAASGDEYEIVQLPFTDHLFDIYWGSFSAQLARGLVQQLLNRYQ
jgi:acetyl esterase/lipase